MLEILVLEAFLGALVPHLEAEEARVVQEQPPGLEVHVADEVKYYKFFCDDFQKRLKNPQLV